MNDSTNSSKGLLVLRYPQAQSQERLNALAKALTPLAEELGLEPVVLDNGADIRIDNGRDALLERVCVALEALVAQGTPPSVSHQEEAPQALNARPPGLNSRPIAEVVRESLHPDNRRG